MSNRIVVVGSINADLMIRVARHPRPGETLPGRGGLLAPGGKGANQAVAAALLGAQVTLVGAIGNDNNAQIALRLLRAAGVDLSAVDQVTAATGLAVVAVDDRGENSIIVIAGANAAVDAELVRRHAGTIADAAIVVLQGETPRAGIELAARLCRGRLIFNLAPVIEVAPEALLRADPLVVNRHEGGLALRLLTGSPPGNGEPGCCGQTAAGHPAHAPAAVRQDGQHAESGPSGVPDPAETVRGLRAAGVPSVVLTLGADGALVAQRDEVTAVPSPVVEAVDTTGAGDAFVGALAHRLANGDALVAAAGFAARVAARSCTRAGTQASYPGRGTELPQA